MPLSAEQTRIHRDLRRGSENALREVPEDKRPRLLVQVQASDIVTLCEALEQLEREAVAHQTSPQPSPASE